MKKFAFLFLLALSGHVAAASAANTLIIPDQGWHLWPDTQAAWKDDVIYLPEEVTLAKLPVNPPTGGWSALDGGNGVTVSLPSTVEEHFWGKFGYRPYTKDEYYYAKNDPEVMNGNYQGVSWWWREIEVPASFQGKQIDLHIRGARQRAEVYVNQQLVGYDIIAETSFTCDITKAVRPGEKNRIAIRVTNPGGRLDWNDGGVVTWGAKSFQESHGFGGLDRGLTLRAHNAVYLSDIWALNTREPRAINAFAKLTNTSDKASEGIVELSVIDPGSGAILVTQNVPTSVPAHREAVFQTALSAPAATLWNLDSPRLYSLRARWKSSPAETVAMSDEASVTFGFRWFEPRGIGREAGLYLNGQRIRLYSAISWGFWGMNGLWPTHDLAEKEVRAAKRLNMNCLNFHRNIGREDVLEKQDELGLLRYMEPGGGIEALGDPFPTATKSPAGPVDMSGRGGEARTFTEKYEETKILRMVRQFRSHPSLVIYNLHNEMSPSFDNPRLFHILRAIQEEDPSRIAVAKSGIHPELQVWHNPDDAPSALLRDDGTGFSGWRDEHTVGGPGVWTDDLYRGPGDFTHRIEDRGEIVDWGEMLGAPSPDHHDLMLKQIGDHGGASYDLKDHQELAQAYDTFLDKWGFRQAFPTTDAFFQSAGDKAFEFWGRVVETARLSESNDMLTMSGWESTAIENHSGLVDNLRNFKGDPDLISKKLAPLLPVVKPRKLIYRAGETAVLDVYLLNETGRAASGKIELTLIDPQGHETNLLTRPAPAYEQDRFVYPIEIGLETPALKSEGAYRLSIKLNGEKPVENAETLLVIQTEAPTQKKIRVGYLGSVPSVLRELQSRPNLVVEPFHDGGEYDLLVDPLEPSGRVAHLDNGSKIQGTDDDALYHSSIRGRPENLHFNFDNLPAGPAKVSLYFCEPVFSEAGKRVFDVEINGKTVLKDFDIFAEAGGQNIAVVKTFTVEDAGGSVTIRPSHVVDHGVSENTRGEALFNAIKIEAGGKVVAVTCGGETYRDKNGLSWQPYAPRGALQTSVLDEVKQGTPLLVLAEDSGSAARAAQSLADGGAFQFLGMVPSVRAPWMGNWVFVRDHPVFAGLPVNEVMRGDYQIPVGACYGVMVDGANVQIIAAYGRDHDRNIGAATFTSRLGKGAILFNILNGMQPVLRERWLSNALTWLSETAGR